MTPKKTPEAGRVFAIATGSSKMPYTFKKVRPPELSIAP
jgi:hypothetical protein